MKTEKTYFVNGRNGETAVVIQTGSDYPTAYLDEVNYFHGDWDNIYIALNALGFNEEIITLTETDALIEDPEEFNAHAKYGDGITLIQYLCISQNLDMLSTFLREAPTWLDISAKGFLRSWTFEEYKEVVQTWHPEYSIERHTQNFIIDYLDCDTIEVE